MKIGYRRLALTLTMLLCASAARAQAYRVVLAVPGGKLAIAEFNVCGSATADCSASIVGNEDGRGALFGLTTRVVSFNKHDSVTVDGGKVHIKALDGRKPGMATLTIGDGVARAVVVSRDSRYAFVLVENATGNPADVMMIDLATQDAVSGLNLETRVLGMALGR